MKKVVSSILLVSASAFAAPLDTEDRAVRLKDKLAPTVLSLSGVNMIGVGACDPLTGADGNFESDWVHCVRIGTDSDSAFARVSSLYPLGTQINGVFVLVEKVGTIGPQPRMSGGN